MHEISGWYIIALFRDEDNRQLHRPGSRDAALAGAATKLPVMK